MFQRGGLLLLLLLVGFSLQDSEAPTSIEPRSKRDASIDKFTQGFTTASSVLTSVISAACPPVAAHVSAIFAVMGLGVKVIGDIANSLDTTQFDPITAELKSISGTVQQNQLILKDIRHRLEEMSTKMEGMFKNIKRHSTELDFESKVVSQSETLWTAVVRVLEKQTAVSIEKFKKSYSENRPSGIVQDLRNRLIREKMNPIIVAMEDQPLRSRMALEEYEHLFVMILLRSYAAEGLYYIIEVAKQNITLKDHMHANMGDEEEELRESFVNFLNSYQFKEENYWPAAVRSMLSAEMSKIIDDRSNAGEVATGIMNELNGIYTTDSFSLFLHPSLESGKSSIESIIDSRVFFSVTGGEEEFKKRLNVVIETKESSKMSGAIQRSVTNGEDEHVKEEIRQRYFNYDYYYKGNDKGYEQFFDDPLPLFSHVLVGISIKKKEEGYPIARYSEDQSAILSEEYQKLTEGYLGLCWP